MCIQNIIGWGIALLLPAIFSLILSIGPINNGDYWSAFKKTIVFVYGSIFIMGIILTLFFLSIDLILTKC